MTRVLGLSLIACLAAGVAGAQLVEPPNVFLDVSMDARNKLGMVDAYVSEGEWTEAIELLQNMIGQRSGKVAPVDPLLPELYVSLGALCHQRLARLPPEGLTLYRARVDSQAADWLAKAEQTGDDAYYQRVVDEFFCSSVTDRALDRLGDHAMSRGREQEALRWWGKLLPKEFFGQAKEDDPNASATLRYPDPKIDQARVAAKWIAAQLLANNLADADRALEIYRQRFPDAKGRLGGRDGRYIDILTDLRRDSATFTPPAVSDDWPTFGGNDRRSKVAPRPIDIGHAQWSWSILQSSDDDTHLAMIERRASVARLPYHPVISGQRAYVATASNVVAYDLETGKQEVWPAFDPAGGGDAGDFSPYYTLAIDGHQLFVRTAEWGPRFANAFPPRGGARGSKLFCYDIRTKKRLWDPPIDAQRMGDPNAVFEGAPVVAGESVYIAMTRYDAMSETSVVCLDRATGAPRWRTIVCEANSDAVNVGAMHNLLTLSDDSIYYCTNLGAVAALNARDGQLRWVATYRRRGSLVSGHSLTAPTELNPCVVYQDRVFAAPSDSTRIFCFDAESGRRLWETQAVNPATHVLGVLANRLIVTGNRVHGVDVQTGKVAWQWPINPAPGYGRGILADGAVYWPTRTQIHVIDPETGRLARSLVELPDEANLKPGNMATGAGYLILAQSDRILALCSPTRSKTKYERELAENPRSPIAHFRLAQVAMKIRDYPLARSHFELARECAAPAQVFQGRSLAAWAIEQRFEALLAEGIADSDANQADALLVEAFAAAPSPRARLRTLQARASLWESNGRQPAQAATQYQAIIDDQTLAPLLVDDGSGSAPRSARAWATAKIADLQQAFGPAVYATYAVEAERRFSQTTDPSALLRLADRFGAAPVSGKILLTAGAGFEADADWSRAIVPYQRLARSSGTAPDECRQALEGLTRVYGSLGYGERRRAAADRLAREFGVEPDVVPAEPKEHRTDFSLEKAWRWTGPASTFLTPAGEPGHPRLRMALRSRPNRLARVRPSDGVIHWEIDVPGVATWAGYSPTGLLVGVAGRVSCHDYDTGAVLWETPLADASPRSPWFEGDAETLAPREEPVGEAPRFLLVGDLALALRADGKVAAIDADNGWRVWESAAPGSIGSPTSLEPLGPFVVVRGENGLAAINVADGRWAFETPASASVADRLPVVVAGRAVVVVDRGAVVAFRLRDGSADWRLELGSPCMDAPRLLVAGDALVVQIDGYRWTRIDPEKGTELWSAPIADRPRKADASAAAVGSEFAISTTGGEWECRSLADGGLRWRQPMPAGATQARVLLLGGLALAWGRDGDDVVIATANLEDGAPRQRIPLAGFPGELALTPTPDALLWATSHECRSLALRAAEPAAAKPSKER